MGAQISSRHNDEQCRNAKRREHVEEFGFLEINKKKDDEGQTKNPQIGNVAAFLRSSSDSLTHFLFENLKRYTRRNDADSIGRHALE